MWAIGLGNTRGYFICKLFRFNSCSRPITLLGFGVLVSVYGGFWALLVKTWVFSSLTSYVLWSFGLNRSKNTMHNRDAILPHRTPNTLLVLKNLQPLHNTMVPSTTQNDTSRCRILLATPMHMPPTMLHLSCLPLDHAYHAQYIASKRVSNCKTNAMTKRLWLKMNEVEAFTLVLRCAIVLVNCLCHVRLPNLYWASPKDHQLRMDCIFTDCSYQIMSWS